MKSRFLLHNYYAYIVCVMLSASCRPVSAKPDCQFRINMERYDAHRRRLSKSAMSPHTSRLLDQTKGYDPYLTRYPLIAQDHWNYHSVWGRHSNKPAEWQC